MIYNGVILKFIVSERLLLVTILQHNPKTPLRYYITTPLQARLASKSILIIPNFFIDLLYFILLL